jgi:hypothetical protein
MCSQLINNAMENGDAGGDDRGRQAQKKSAAGV